MSNLKPDRALIFRITHIAKVPWLLEHGLHCRNSPEFDPNFRPAVWAPERELGGGGFAKNHERPRFIAGMHELSRQAGRSRGEPLSRRRPALLESRSGLKCASSARTGRTRRRWNRPRTKTPAT